MRLVRSARNLGASLTHDMTHAVIDVVRNPSSDPSTFGSLLAHVSENAPR